MTTKKQISANRRNAKKSTGPRSDGGRSISRMNAVKHGALSEATPSPRENISGYNDYLIGLRREYCPQNVRENQLVERVALLLWREVRLAKYEVELISMGHASKSFIEEPVYRVADAKRNAFRNGVLPIEEQLGIARYQTSLSNQLRQAFADLEDLVTSRDQGMTQDDDEEADCQDVDDDTSDDG
jgi:hypothetical protein